MFFQFDNSPRSWYEHDVSLSIELLKEYIAGIERQIQESLEHFEENREVRFEDLSDHDVNISQRYGSLDENYHDVDLNYIFEEYFPSIQRRSALITVYSFLEFELNKLCKHFKQAENIGLSLKDINGKGIQQALTYLTKVVGLNIGETESQKEIRFIQRIRNRIVHQNSELPRESNQEEDSKLIKYVLECIKKNHLSEKSVNYAAIYIEKDYLPHILKTFDRRFQEIDKAIKTYGT